MTVTVMCNYLSIRRYLWGLTKGRGRSGRCRVRRDVDTWLELSEGPNRSTRGQSTAGETPADTRGRPSRGNPTTSIPRLFARAGPRPACSRGTAGVEGGTDRRRLRGS